MPRRAREAPTAPGSAFTVACGNLCFPAPVPDDGARAATSTIGPWTRGTHGPERDDGGDTGGDVSLEEIEDALVDGDTPLHPGAARPGPPSRTGPSASSFWAPTRRTSAPGCRTSSWVRTPMT